MNDVEGLVRRLEEQGDLFPVELVQSPSGASVAFCLGPDNVYLELIERP